MMSDKHPDWRNPDDYPGPEATDYQFAWEFLRRNVNYREFYEKEGKKWTPGKKLSKEVQNDFGLEPSSALVNPSSPNPYTTVYYGGTQENPEMKINFAILFMGEDPRISRGDNSHGSGPNKTASRVQGCIAPDTQVNVQFDLRASLEPQIEKAKQYLTALAVSAPKFRSQRNLYARYLRVFDAMEQGIDKVIIGRTLFPEKKNKENTRKAVENAYDSARNMTRDGYRLLGVGAFLGKTVPQRTFVILPQEK